MPPPSRLALSVTAGGRIEIGDNIAISYERRSAGVLRVVIEAPRDVTINHRRAGDATTDAAERP